jgi:hypothetical protein
MQTQFSLSVIHPAFELLKRSAKILHFMAAAIILINAVYILQVHGGSKVLFFTQLVIAFDIFLLVFFGGIVLQDAPKLNLIFRLIETLTIFGIAQILYVEGHSWFALLHVCAASSFLFLFYREWRVVRSEAVDIKPTGISFPNFVKDAEISWNEIKTIVPKYHSIIIETLRHKKIEFNLRQNLKIDELQQIDEFCKKHLVAQ